MPRFVSEVLVSGPPDPALNACVVVPARNEEELLPGALYALAEQKQLNGQPVPYESYEVVLLINNSTDASRAAAERVARMYPSLRLHIIERWFNSSQAHIGHVRRLLMDEACRRLETAGNDLAVILSTDSDSRVAPNWIASNRNELAGGIEAIGGRIVLTASEQTGLDLRTRQLHEQDNVYRRLVSWLEWILDPAEHDPWPRHHYNFGASLALTPQVYKRVGRLPPRRCLEDVALYQKLVLHDAKLRHSNKVRVYTSGRLNGRAKFGLSRTLADVQRQTADLSERRVESRAFLEFLFAIRFQLRAIWLQRHSCPGAAMEKDAGSLARAAGLSKETLLREIRGARYFGSLLERVRFYENCRRLWPDWRRLVPLDTAISDLYRLFRPTIESRQTATRCQPTS